MTDLTSRTIAAQLRGLADTLDPPAPTTPIDVDIPGRFTARYLPGTATVDRLTFTPAGSDAGWLGPLARTYQAGADEALRVDDTDGPFWVAMRAALATVTERGVIGPRVEIEWTE